jgi:hypothetical protein
VAEFRQKMQRPEYRAIYRQRAPVAEFSHACLKEKKGLVSIWIRPQGKLILQART